MLHAPFSPRPRWDEERIRFTPWPHWGSAPERLWVSHCLVTVELLAPVGSSPSSPRRAPGQVGLLLTVDASHLPVNRRISVVDRVRVQHPCVATVRYPLSTVYRPLFTGLGSLFNVHYSLFAVHCSLFTLRCSLFTVHCSLFTVHCPGQPALPRCPSP
jgi:hypothetical protein